MSEQAGVSGWRRQDDRSEEKVDAFIAAVILWRNLPCTVCWCESLHVCILCWGADGDQI